MTDQRLNLLTYLSTHYVPIQKLAQDLDMPTHYVRHLARCCGTLGVEIQQKTMHLRIHPLSWPVASKLADDYFERHIR